MIPKRTRQGATADIPCDLIDSVEVNQVNLLEPGPQAVLKIVASSWCEYTFLVALKETLPGMWKLVQTVPFFSKYDTPKITFESLIGPKEKEIIVMDLDTDAGTGMSQKNVTILKLFSGGLKVIFDEPTDVTFAIPIKGYRDSD